MGGSASQRSGIIAKRERGNPPTNRFIRRGHGQGGGRESNLIVGQAVLHLENPSGQGKGTIAEVVPKAIETCGIEHPVAGCLTTSTRREGGMQGWSEDSRRASRETDRGQQRDDDREEKSRAGDNSHRDNQMITI